MLERELAAYAAALAPTQTRRSGPGYWLNEVYVATSQGSLLPVVLEPFSTKEDGFLSQNALILDAMEYVYEATGDRGTWISDRGYDDKKFLIVCSTKVGFSPFA